MSKSYVDTTERSHVSGSVTHRLPELVMNILLLFKQVIFHTQLDIVAMGVAGTLVTMMVLSLPPNPAPLVVGLVAYGVYVGDRVSDAKQEPEATAERAAFYRRNERLLSVTSAVAYGLAIAISTFGGPVALGLTLIPGVSWVIYASDWTDFEGTSLNRLKSVFVLNSTIVAFAWGIAMVFLPVAFAGSGVSAIAVVLLVYFFVDIFVNTEIPNVRDVEDDRKAGVDTFPTVLGVEKTRHALYILNGVLVLFLIGVVVSTQLTAVIVGTLLIGRAVALFLNFFVGRIEDYRVLEMAGELNHVLVAVLLFGLVW